MKEKDEYWIEIRNWEKFQHYKKESKPAWIKLYANLDTDENWIQLSPSARGILVELWLAAARTANKIVMPKRVLEKLAHCRIPYLTLKTLEEHGFIFLHSRVTLENSYTDSRETLPREEKRREEKKQISPYLGSPLPSLLEIWNSNRGQLPEVLRLTSKRSKAWEARWKEQPEESYWKTVIQRLATSAFCVGQNDRGWRADVDFFLKPETHIKVMEGKYDNHLEEVGHGATTGKTVRSARPHVATGA